MHGMKKRGRLSARGHRGRCRLVALAVLLLASLVRPTWQGIHAALHHEFEHELAVHAHETDAPMPASEALRLALHSADPAGPEHLHLDAYPLAAPQRFTPLDAPSLPAAIIELAALPAPARALRKVAPPARAGPECLACVPARGPPLL
jgi:hypothetical protein